MAGKFKVGQVVQLRSGGPEMTVSDISDVMGNKEKVRCQWFGGRKLEGGTFPEESLVEVPADEEEEAAE